MTDCVGQQLGNYQLLKLLGQGACTNVYLGKHRYLNSYAALKVLFATDQYQLAVMIYYLPKGGMV